MITSKMEKDVVRIKVEQQSPHSKPATISLLDCGLTNDDFLNNMSHDVSSLMSPLSCDKCEILSESNKKLESHVQTIMESLRMTQEENAGLKLQLKLSDIQMGEHAQEIEKLKKEIALAKAAQAKDRSNVDGGQSLSVSPSSRSPGGGGGSKKRRRSSSNTPPNQQAQQIHQSALAQLQKMSPPQVSPMPNAPWGSCRPPMGSNLPLMGGNPPPSGSYPRQMANNHPQMTSTHPLTTSNQPQMSSTHPLTTSNHPPMTRNHPLMTSNHPPASFPTKDRYILHGIDGSKINSGYFCICKERFSMEPLLYKHLKHVITSQVVTMSPAPSSTSPPSSPYQWNVVVCSICKERFVNWEVFRYHTMTIHGVRDLETFEWNELNMNRHIYQSNPNPTQTQSSSYGQQQQ